MTLVELFEEYKQDPREKWISDYRKTCDKVQRIINGEEELDLKFVEYLWTDRTCGVAGIGPYALVTKTEFENLKPDILDFTNEIFADPSPAGYSKAIQRVDDFKTKKLISKRRIAPTSRIFAAAAPRIYTSVIDRSAINSLILYLVTNHSIGISKNGDWAHDNSQLLEKIKAIDPIFEDADPFLLNTFIWWLYSDQIKAKEEAAVGGESMQSTHLGDIPTQFEIMGLNTIFYGPPGTGKTFLTQQLKNQYTTEANKLTQDQWADEVFGDLPWWKVIAAALHNMGGRSNVPQIKAHPFISAKLRKSDNSNINQTLWGNLQTHSLEDSETIGTKGRRPPHIFDKTSDSYWELQEGWDEICEDVVDAVKKFQAGQSADGVIKRYEFITFHQSYSYEEFIEGIRPVLKDNAQEDSAEDRDELEYELADGIFKRICRKAFSDPQNNYAIFIDEINRGNISKIFGELITLIEDDKRRDYRLPEPNGLEIKLPYSQKVFSVPKNLHIIGTMNTADRSLTLMDTALRRRFSFVEIMPDPERIAGLTVTDGSSTVDIASLLIVLNERIEVLYDREHALGHAFFMGSEWKTPSLEGLKETFTQKIIPLLQEYFFDDWEKIRLVLGDNQKDLKENQFITKSEVNNYNLFGDADINGFELNKFEINQGAFGRIEAYIQIYAPKSMNQEPEA